MTDDKDFNPGFRVICGKVLYNGEVACDQHRVRPIQAATEEFVTDEFLLKGL